jgi:hypothetical protein
MGDALVADAFIRSSDYRVAAEVAIQIVPLPA